jgi:diacylglycerol kinase
MREFLRGFGYASKGLIAAFISERNIRVHLAIAIITVAAGFYFDITSAEWCAVIICIGLVLAFEVMNTAIEDLVDLVTEEWTPLAGRVKDAAAGAVLIVSITSLAVGIIIFRKYLM